MIYSDTEWKLIRIISRELAKFRLSVKLALPRSTRKKKKKKETEENITCHYSFTTLLIYTVKDTLEKFSIQPKIHWSGCFAVFIHHIATWFSFFCYSVYCTYPNFIFLFRPQYYISWFLCSYSSIQTLFAIYQVRDYELGWKKKVDSQIKEECISISLLLLIQTKAGYVFYSQQWRKKRQ